MFVLNREGTFIEFYQPPNSESLCMSPDEFIGKSINDVLPKEVAEPFRKAIEAVKRTGEVQQVEYMLETFHGKQWFHAKFSLRGDGNGAFSGITVVARDVTERKRMAEERLMLQRRQLTEKTASLSRMAGAVAHHFNNMLAGVIGNLELAKEGLVEKSNILKNLSEAEKAAHRAAEMSGLMLTYLGNSEMHKTAVDLSELCRRHVERIRRGLPENIRLETDFPVSGPVIDADSTQIERVLSAIVTNAIEAMGDSNGDLGVSVETKMVSDIAENRRFPVEYENACEKYACLVISDTGCGMDANTVDRIFDPFYTDKFTGRGLGLPVGLGIVKSHNGFIAVDSEPGKGSDFKLLFPLSSETAPLSESVVSTDLEAHV
jgi:PAS domain S-box-containing protein